MAAPDVAQVLEVARALKRDQIADLACELLRVLDDDAPEIDQAKVDAVWRAEFRRRIDDIESGKVQLVSHDETVSQARAMLAAQRRRPSSLMTTPRLVLTISTQSGTTSNVPGSAMN